MCIMFAENLVAVIYTIINWHANVCQGSCPMLLRSGILEIFQMGAQEIRCPVATPS